MQETERFVRGQQRGLRSAAWGVAACAIILAAAEQAAAQRASGIQLSPDSATYIISKDVGNERWAITYNLDRKVVIGNVFPQDGGAPSFLYCAIDRVDQNADPMQAQYHLSCQFAQPCAQAPCADQWGAPFPVPPIPGSFFLPTGTLATYAGNVQPVFNTSCALNASCHVAGGAGGLDLSAGMSYSHIFEVTAAQSPGKDYVTAFDPVISYLMNKIDGTGVGSRMPLGGPVLPPATADQIRAWIVEGAANN